MSKETFIRNNSNPIKIQEKEWNVSFNKSGGIRTDDLADIPLDLPSPPANHAKFSHGLSTLQSLSKL